MIRFDGVSKIYEGHVHALCDVSFHLGKGEMAFLMGPSGAGKTTLLKLIYGEEFPSDGVVEVAGHDVSHLRRRQIPYLRRRIGVVFQDFRLLSDRTIYENLDLVLLIAGFPASERKKRVLSALASVGLSHKIRNYPHDLSGGEQQRIAIARALVVDPLIILADEPTGNLDPDLSNYIVQLLRSINARGTAILMATHNYQLVQKTQGRVLMLKEGHIVADQEHQAPTPPTTTEGQF
jgi:cell division transport system ATP-binding protein